MANANLVTRMIDSTNRVLLKMVGTLDGTGQETSTIKIDVSSLAFALNANGYVMSSNVNPLPLYRLFPKKINFEIGIPNGYVKLHYDTSNASHDETIAILAGSGEMFLEGMVLNQPFSQNSNGDICLTTLGAGANSTYTILLDCKKDPRDYDQGQGAEPAAFNKGIRGI